MLPPHDILFAPLQSFISTRPIYSWYKKGANHCSHAHALFFILCIVHFHYIFGYFMRTSLCIQLFSLKYTSQNSKYIVTCNVRTYTFTELFTSWFTTHSCLRKRDRCPQHDVKYYPPVYALLTKKFGKLQAILLSSSLGSSYFIQRRNSL